MLVEIVCLKKNKYYIYYPNLYANNNNPLILLSLLQMRMSVNIGHVMSTRIVQIHWAALCAPVFLDIKAMDCTAKVSFVNVYTSIIYYFVYEIIK